MLSEGRDLSKINFTMSEDNVRMQIQRADGTVELPLDAEHLRRSSRRRGRRGFDACAIVFVHGYRHPAHEAEAAELARAAGFAQVSVSHRVSPLMKMVSRGDTTVVDAYLTPILRRYIDRVAAAFERRHGGKLMFMQSSGGLTGAGMFQGKDAILRPAGGVVGAVRTSADRRAGSGSSASTWAGRRRTSVTMPASSSGCCTPRSRGCGSPRR